MSKSFEQINYIHGISAVHRFDVRFKFLFLLIISIISFKLSFYGLVFLTLFLFFLTIESSLPLFSVLKKIKSFYIFLIIIFLVRSFRTSPPYIFQYKFIYFSKEATYLGFLFIFRLFIITSFSLLFIMSTKSKEVRFATYYYLKFIPFFPAERVSFMLSLIFRFIPALFTSFKELDEAQKSRNIELKKNPIYRMKKFIFPFIRLVFKDASDLTDAIESRNFSEVRTKTKLPFTSEDWFFFLILICFMFIVFFI